MDVALAILTVTAGSGTQYILHELLCATMIKHTAFRIRGDRFCVSPKPYTIPFTAMRIRIYWEKEPNRCDSPLHSMLRADSQQCIVLVAVAVCEFATAIARRFRRQHFHAILQETSHRAENKRDDRWIKCWMVDECDRTIFSLVFFASNKSRFGFARTDKMR